jgi:hypothetical protein
MLGRRPVLECLALRTGIMGPAFILRADGLALEAMPWARRGISPDGRAPRRTIPADMR